MMQSSRTLGAIAVLFTIPLSPDTHARTPAPIGSWSVVSPLAVDGLCHTEQAKLLASDGAAVDNFGVSVSVDGDTALVGAHRDDDHGNATGAAYVYVRDGSTWIQRAKLLPPPGVQGSLGVSVSLDGDTALVGAPNDSENGSSAGAAYVFVRTGQGWTRVAKLRGEGIVLNSFLGISVCLEGDTAIVGAFWDFENTTRPGSAYLFERVGSSWRQRANLSARDGAHFDHFGVNVAVSGETLVVGALSDDDNGTNSGSAYVFALPPDSGTIYCTCPVGPCGNRDADAGCANSTGVGALLVANGTTQPDEVGLLILGARPNQFGIFFQANNAIQNPFGDGFLCAGGATVRITPTPVQIGSDGSIGYGPCYGDPSISEATGVVPGSGDIRRYQFWYCDPGGPCGAEFNLSNGYEITW